MKINSKLKEILIKFFKKNKIKEKKERMFVYTFGVDEEPGGVST